MATSILGSVTLGYRPLWDKTRALAALQLWLAPYADQPLDVAQLVHSLQELASPGSPQLLLSPTTPGLLRDLLDHAPRSPYWIEVRHDWLEHTPAIAQRVSRAQQRGLQLVWRGESDQQPSAALANCFFTRLIHLSPQAALAGLQAAARVRASAASQARSMGSLGSPIRAGYLYEGIASRLLADHCLDQQDAGALLGWPDEDVLHALLRKATPPDHQAMLQLILGVEADVSVEKLEALLGREPILTFRFLAYANSAAVGLRTDIESLRHGLMLLGTTKLKEWLQEQLPQGSHAPNLRPVKAAMVLRARLMENLMDSGAEHQLAREIYLCGLFSQIDVLMGEPLGSALHRVPLSSRIYNATVRNSGPYAPLLQMASALETDNAPTIRRLAREHEMGQEHINRALLKAMG